ncbi:MULTISPECIES: DNA-processing protein DprA [Aphanothece]|uniref:DNA-processing protein DprA n=1 Tax=Aphanothece TaxID=1121 RepID=UPI00398E6DEC
MRLRAIEDHFGSLLQAWQAPPEAFLSLPGLGPAWLRQLQRFRAHWGAEPLAAFSAAVAGGRRALLPGDPTYPAAVASLERPALALRWRGQGSLWPLLARRAAVAVVGTRRPSRHGLAMAEALGAALATAGWPVVSGLAEGIDAAAHRGCLAERGRPVAVLGTPLERVYPRHHTQLQRQVGERGLLVSEHPPGASVRPGHFAARNRLQVALVRAVVVVECPEQSGALQSAGLAWQQQLPLWVVPADAARLSARGSNRLLSQGATPLLEPADLIRQLGAAPLAPRAGSLPCGSAAAPLAGVEGALLAALAEGASLEQLCQLTQESAPQIAARLLALELAGLVRAEPGLRWRRL